MDILRQKFLIFGLSKSGYAVFDYLHKKGNLATVVDGLKSIKSKENAEKILNLGATIYSEEEAEKVLDTFDVLVLSPGVAINHRLCLLARQLNKRIIGEVEFGMGCFTPLNIAVTGTNGKTTTATLISEILTKSGVKNYLTGNIGTPITAMVDDVQNDVVIVNEISSFQLESSNLFSPHIACILNISEDHLERHYTMENYLYLKKKIYAFQKESEYLILNYDDENLRLIYSETRAKVIWVSIDSEVKGAYTLNDKIYFNQEEIMDINCLSLKGSHNVYNSLFAIAVAKILEVKNQDIISALQNFKGVPHRIEFINKINGVSYYNDSKATNSNSTINAINSMENPTTLILGGSDKGEDFTNLFDKIKNSMVKQVILTGANRYKLLDSANNVGVKNLSVIEDFESAVKFSALVSESGDNVLLSPASASFDRFSGYEERGKVFRELVGEIASQQDK